MLVSLLIASSLQKVESGFRLPRPGRAVFVHLDNHTAAHASQQTKDKCRSEAAGRACGWTPSL